MTTSTNLHHDLRRDLESLQDDYTYRVNLLLDEGREDLASVVADQYVAAAADLLQRSAEPASA
jgi:hypothetical protein